MTPISHIEVLDLILRANKSVEFMLDIKMLNILDSMLMRQNIYCTFSFKDLVEYSKSVASKVRITDDTIAFRPSEKSRHTIRYISNMYLTKDKITKFNLAWKTLELK